MAKSRIGGIHNERPATTPIVVSGRARASALLALVAAAAIWGSTFVVTELLLEEAEPLFIAAARFALALLSPLVARPYGRSPGTFRRPAFIALGLLGVAGNFALQNVGLAYTDAADAALIIALTPVPIAVLASLLLGEALGARRLIGIAVSIAGVVLITGTGAEASGGPCSAIS